MAMFFQAELYPHSAESKMSIGDFEQRVDSKAMCVPDYQRRYVWSKAEQQGYLASISKGFPLFGPVVNLDMDTGIQSVMDGQNRLWTIYKFLKDDIKFKDEDEEIVVFSRLPDNQQRRFKAITISYLETRGWSQHHCQEFFVAMNGGGTKLKAGELINSDRENIFSQTIVALSDTYKDILGSKASSGGFQLSPAYMKRYGHYEFLGTVFHMVGTGEFPVRPGPTALEELDKWRRKTESDIFTTSRGMVEMIFNSHKVLLTNVPRLSQKVSKETHLRLMYFLLKTELYLQELYETHFTRIETMLNIVLNKDNPEYTQTVKWSTGDCNQIYHLYKRLYDAN